MDPSESTEHKAKTAREKGGGAEAFAPSGGAVIHPFPGLGAAGAHGPPKTGPRPGPSPGIGSVNGSGTGDVAAEHSLASTPASVLLRCLGDMVFRIRKDGTVMDMQCPEDHELGLSADGIVGRRVVELLPTQVGLQAMHHLEKVLRTGQSKRVCCPYNLPGRAREYQVRMAPAGPGEVVAVVRDVTDRRVFEKEILDVSHRAQLRIGQDLHDGLGQHLTGITFLSKALENKLAARQLPEAADAEEIARLVIQALAQTRNLARGVFPVELESGGLVPALKELANTMKSLFKLTCVVDCEANLRIHNRDMANHLFRLAQEAVNNAVKHAHAQRVDIRLYRDGENTVLAVTDDGAGFDAQERKWSGLGLRIMRYRAKKIGAHLEFNSATLGGTQMVCRFRNVPGEEDESRGT